MSGIRDNDGKLSVLCHSYGYAALTVPTALRVPRLASFITKEIERALIAISRAKGGAGAVAKGTEAAKPVVGKTYDVMNLPETGAEPPSKPNEPPKVDPPTRPALPPYNGKTTEGVFVDPNGKQIPFSSGGADPKYKNYIPASHVEGKAAIYMRENGIKSGTVYHNNPNGTCP